MPRPALSLALVLLACPLGARADEPFALGEGGRVVFFGDSITQAGGYVAAVEAYLLTRFPDRRYEVINHGISSETVAGTSEPDHPGRRPDAHDRFARDVAAWRPDVVVACFGMNDGIYHPFSPERFALYRAGVRRLIERTQSEAKARLIVLTPPPFDPYRRASGDPEAVHFGYRFPAIDYDSVLDRYSRWLLDLRGEGLVVADAHGAINEHLRRRREGRVSFSVSPDAVHPDATGHWLMAQALLLASHAPAEVAEARVEARPGGPRAIRGDLTDLRHDGDALAFTWLSPLPMPLDPACDAESLALEDVSGRLNRYRLAVTDLPRPRYRLLAAFEGAEPAPIAEVGREDLSRGVDLTTLPEFPTVARARALFARLDAQRRASYAAWRKAVADGPAGQAGPPEAEAAESAAIRRLAQPARVSIRLVPIDL